MTVDDAQQHKQRVVDVFDTIAAGYDNVALRFFSFAADRVIKILKPRPGQKILDIATGTGAIAISCAQVVKPDGRVIAIDLSQAMLDMTLQNTRRMGLNNVDQFQMDADTLEFRENYFDHSICSFALFFLPDMQKALIEWVRVTKPGGKVLFSSFSEASFDPMVKLLVEQLESCGLEMNNPPFATQRLSDPDVCKELMIEVELESTSVTIEQVGYHLQCVEDWWSIVWNSGMRGLVQRLDEGQQIEFKKQHLESVQSLFGERGLWLNVEVQVSQGVVPT